jgi:hypothetical protein
LKAVSQHMATLVNPTLGIAGSPANKVCLKFEDALIYLAGPLVNKEKHKRKNEARRLLTGLTTGGFIGTTLDANQDTWCWVV